MTEFTLTARLTKGKLCVRAWSRLAEVLKHWRDGEYTITIERKHANRSQKQNAYWWGVCVRLVSEHTGYDPDDVHELAKHMFLPKHLAVADGNGEVVGEYVLGGSTSKLNTLEFGEFIERFRRWAAETLDVAIPDPDQYYQQHEDAA